MTCQNVPEVENIGAVTAFNYDRRCPKSMQRQDRYSLYTKRSAEINKLKGN